MLELVNSYPYLIPVVFIGLLGLFSLWAIKTKQERAEENVFTLGIIFGGGSILLGLSSLDLANTADALPTVIGHIRDGVLINVAGMLCKVGISFSGKKAKETGAGGLQVDFTPLITQMEKNEEQAGKRANDLSNRLKQNQEQTQESFRELNGTLNGVLSELAKGATKEIITALENVIERFNQNLTEQFGENFKRLNEACLKLVQWQEQYRQELSTLQETNTQISGQLQSVANNLVTITSAIEQVATRSGSFVESAKTLESLYGNLTANLNEMKSMLERLKDVPQEAANSMNKLVVTVDEGAKTVREHNTALANQNLQFAGSLKEALADGQKQITSSVQEQGVRFTEVLGNSTRSLVEIADRHREESTRLLANVKTELADISKQSCDGLRQNANQVAATMETSSQKLDRTAESLAAKVSDTTERFTRESMITIERNSGLISDQVKRAIDSLTRSSDDLSNQQRTTNEGIKRMGEEMVSTLKLGGAELARSLDGTKQAVSNAMQDVTGELNRGLIGVTSKLSDGVKAIGDEMTYGLDNVTTKLESGVGEISQKIAQSVDEIGREYTGAIKAVEEHGLTFAQTAHDNLNHALERFATIINDALVHSLKQSISAANMAEKTDARMSNFEREHNRGSR